VGRRGDGFGSSGRFDQGFSRFSRPDRLDVGSAQPSGVYPRKGRGYGQIGEAAYPDLFRHWNQQGRWASWRRGMELAFTQLNRDTSQFQSIEVLSLPEFSPQDGFIARRSLAIGFPSRLSPEGRWTTVIKPRGTEIAPVPIGANAQFDVTATSDDGQVAPLLVVQLPGCWQPGALAAGSGLIGELVEDSAISATALDPDPSDGIALLCVAVYQDDGLMVFDGSQFWQRQRQRDGSLLLRHIIQTPEDPPLRFRVGRHLTQSTVVSCNCPAHLGVAYGRLRPDTPLGSQGLFPQRGPGGASDLQLPLRDAIDAILRQEPEKRPVDAMEGAARRFALLDWRRLPEEACKHCHAARFALGAPTAEPSDVPVMLGSDAPLPSGELLPYEEFNAPLASAGFIERLNRQAFDAEAWKGLASTITTGAVGDAWTVTVERIGLPPNQIDGTFPGNCAPRFSQQQLTAEPQAAEDSLLGDVWAGRLTQAYSYPYLAPGELLDQPFYLPSAEPPLLAP
jgi:hypothetical protein